MDQTQNGKRYGTFLKCQCYQLKFINETKRILAFEVFYVFEFHRKLKYHLMVLCQKS